jgi:DNA-directed RNA polymerase specialized sigma24 family protein
MLKYHHGYNTNEIADMFGMKPAAVRKLYYGRDCRDKD